MGKRKTQNERAAKCIFDRDLTKTQDIQTDICARENCLLLVDMRVERRSGKVEGGKGASGVAQIDTLKTAKIRDLYLDFRDRKGLRFWVEFRHVEYTEIPYLKEEKKHENVDISNETAGYKPRTKYVTRNKQVGDVLGWNFFTNLTYEAWNWSQGAVESVSLGFVSGGHVRGRARYSMEGVQKNRQKRHKGVRRVKPERKQVDFSHFFRA